MQPSVDASPLAVHRVLIESFGPSLVQIQLPPSIPLWTARGSVAGILGPAIEFAAKVKYLTVRQYIAPNLVTRLLSLQPLLLQRLETTRPVTILVGSRSRKNLEPLVLDGQIDWVICRGAKLQTAVGDALSVHGRSGFAPSRVHVPHLQVQGRGAIVLTSNGPLVRVGLAEGESIMVQQAHLAAYSRDGAASVPTPKLITMQYTLAPPQESPVPHTGYERVDHFMACLIKLSTAFWRRVLARYHGADNFVCVYGPSSVLVSSAAVIKREPHQNNTTDIVAHGA